MKKEDIIAAYCKIRTIDNTIPDDVLDFMKDAAIEKLENSKKCKTFLSKGDSTTKEVCIFCGIERLLHPNVSN